MVPRAKTVQRDKLCPYMEGNHCLVYWIKNAMEFSHKKMPTPSNSHNMHFKRSSELFVFFEYPLWFIQIFKYSISSPSLRKIRLMNKMTADCFATTLTSKLPRIKFGAGSADYISALSESSCNQSTSEQCQSSQASSTLHEDSPAWPQRLVVSERSLVQLVSWTRLLSETTGAYATKKSTLVG